MLQRRPVLLALVLLAPLCAAAPAAGTTDGPFEYEGDAFAGPAHYTGGKYDAFEFYLFQGEVATATLTWSTPNTWLDLLADRGVRCDPLLEPCAVPEGCSHSRYLDASPVTLSFVAHQDGYYAFHVSGGLGTKDPAEPIGHVGQQVPYHVSITIGENSGANRVWYRGEWSYLSKGISECRLPSL